MRMTTTPLALAIAALGATLVTAGCQRPHEGIALPADPTPVQITPSEGQRAAAAATQGGGSAAAAPTVTLTGAVEPHRRATLGPSVSGTVRAVHFEEGETVRRGDILVQLDTTSLDLQLRQVNANIAAARVQVKAAKVEAARAARLVASKAAPARQLDQATATLDAARAQLRVVSTQKAMVERGIYESAIRAPYDAVLTRRHISEGEAATAQPPTQLVTIEQRSPVDVRIDVPSVRVRHVQVGTRLRLRFPATGATIVAPVTRVVPSLDPRTRSAAAIVELANADGTVWPGLFVEADILGAGHDSSADAPTAVAPPRPDTDTAASPEVVQ